MTTGYYSKFTFLMIVCGFIVQAPGEILAQNSGVFIKRSVHCPYYQNELAYFDTAINFQTFVPALIKG